MRSSLPAPALAGALLLLAGLLSGCATPQTRALLEHRPGGLPETAELEALPFFPQERYQCGPAALATVLAGAGIPVLPETLVPEVYLPAREGSLQPEMLAAARRRGLLAYPLAPRLEDVLREVAAGNPVIVLQNLSLPVAPLWHYAVVVGHDLNRGEIVLRSGTTRRLVMPLAVFERTWERGERWAMVAAAPQRLPATASEERYVAAAVALERASPGAARIAYATALGRWPRNLVARIGLGNTAYAAGDLAAAEVAYRQATRDHPDSGDAWNNLAQALFRLGHRVEAETAARHALSLGGPRRAAYEATLNAIAGRR